MSTLHNDDSPEPGAVRSAAAVRELAAAEPPEGVADWERSAWYAEKLGAMTWHAQTLADEIDRRAGVR
jgi:hypothetical protein